MVVNCQRNSSCYKLWIRRDMEFLVECSSILYKTVKKEKRLVAYKG